MLKLADWIDETAPETLGFYAVAHARYHQRLKATNAIEHDRAEVRDRTRVVHIFPNERCYLPVQSNTAEETVMLRQSAWALRTSRRPNETTE